MKIFNEQSLKKDIGAIWGFHGAHMDVYNMLLEKSKSARTVRPKRPLNKPQPAIAALKKLYDACYLADCEGELSERVKGEIMDEAMKVLQRAGLR